MATCKAAPPCASTFSLHLLLLDVEGGRAPVSHSSRGGGSESVRGWDCSGKAYQHQGLILLGGGEGAPSSDWIALADSRQSNTCIGRDFAPFNRGVYPGSSRGKQDKLNV